MLHQIQEREAEESKSRLELPIGFSHRLHQVVLFHLLDSKVIFFPR